MRIACITTKPNARLPERAGTSGVFALRSRHEMSLKSGSYYLYSTGLVLNLPAGYMCRISESHDARTEHIYCSPFFVVSGYETEIILRLVNTSDSDVDISEDIRLFDLVVLHSPCRPNDEFYFAGRVPE